MLSWCVGPFKKRDDLNPVVAPSSEFTFECPMRGERVAWMAGETFNPTLAIDGDRLAMLFRAEDLSSAEYGRKTSRIGLAWSDDGETFEVEPTPVVFPDDQFAAFEHPGGCEDPRICRLQDGRWLLLYTGWNRRRATLMSATSIDLQTWTKHGPALAPPHDREWSKSGAVVVADGVAAKIDGRYWMYYGESDVFLASSEDGVRWKHVGSVMRPKEAGWQSRLVEPGPAAQLTDEGIVLVYNAKSDQPGAPYAAGQALFDARDPSKLLSRTPEPFFVADRPLETKGQYGGVVFVQGLARYRERWILAYGAADSRVCLAEAR